MNITELINYLVNNPEQLTDLTNLCIKYNLDKEEVLQKLALKYKELSDNSLITLPGVHKNPDGTYRVNHNTMPVFLDPKKFFSRNSDRKIN